MKLYSALRWLYIAETCSSLSPIDKLVFRLDLHSLYSQIFHLVSGINLLAPELFFLILAHPVYKMWIKQELNTLELWNKLHFEEKKTESIYIV